MCQTFLLGDMLREAQVELQETQQLTRLQETDNSDTYSESISCLVVNCSISARVKAVLKIHISKMYGY